MIKIKLNGEEVSLETISVPISVQDLLDKYKLDQSKVAVERNLEIVPASAFANTQLQNNDNIEIIHFIGGG